MIDKGYEFMLRFDDSEGAKNWSVDFDNDTANSWSQGQDPTDPSRAVIYAYENYQDQCVKESKIS